jgi:hypothetical protein
MKVLGSKYQSKLLEIIDERLVLNCQNFHSLKHINSLFMHTGCQLLPNIFSIMFSQLPDFLGGKCRCEEDGGCSKSDKGPWKDPIVIEVFCSSHSYY